eukprot:g8887.t1
MMSDSVQKICVDGNTAAAMSAFKMIDTSFIYPITPSTTMADCVEKWATAGKKNVFGNNVAVRQTQAEIGAAASMHGALVSGSLCSTFTSSQGLLLMVPNIYHIAGECLPGVFHISLSPSS